LNPLDDLLVEVLGLETGRRFEDTVLMEDLPNLDSLRFMALLTAIEQRFALSIAVEDMMDIESVGDLRRLLARDTVDPG